MNGKPTALITGASSGIGAQLAQVFARHGYDLVLIARSGAPLNHLAEILATQHQAAVKILLHDLSHPNAPEVIVAQLQQTGIEINILVNNAGFGSYGLFAETDGGLEWQMMQVNMVALTQLTKLLLPGMIERGSGKILNVASTAAFQPGPWMAVYYATKAYVLSFSEALATELRGTGVTLTVLCPGPTASAFQGRSQMDRSKIIHNWELMSAAVVAEFGYRALFAGQVIAIPGWQNRFLAWGVRWLPRRWACGLVAQMQAPAPEAASSEFMDPL
ncbi:SDR family oxidoreductase [Spirulina sp. CCNP1310]|uniref:SDR family NAD(P)-dependent oxidoreductase n=1 Tax=Spirulina sp. CCNP1310 TaxID=3110249 RepID=UPI002B1F0093|nr:SDR family oxidoreductase [Spirulina sp. CCNP1310]MEA5420714.1 SDR family oxidoreductase [Spirulina sp. CCNP1310]